MHYHELLFSAEATAVLKKAYARFLHKLNLGKTLQPAYLGALTLVMRQQLYAQEGLAAFWQQAEAAPDSTYHLHLMHRDKELLNLPWQMAIDEDKHPAVYISKGDISEKMPAAYMPQAGPLKILIMISSPEDGQAKKRLSYEMEEEVLLAALKPLYEKDQVQVSFTYSGSLESLEANLAREHFHMLYFSGHGAYKHNTGYLVLEDEDTLEGIEVTADVFAATVCKYQPHIPALVVLASCRSAEGDVEEGFPGVADELMAAGVPAVIAMAFSIPDRYVTVFAALLFAWLGQQETLLTAYVKALHGLEAAETDYAIEEDYDLAATQWLVPQLYCSRPVQHIVQWAGNETTTTKTSANTTVDNQDDYMFIGRRMDLGFLLPLLHAGKPVLIIGQEGVGKTSLAQKAIQRLLAANSRLVPFRFGLGRHNMEAIKIQLQEFLFTHGMAPMDNGGHKTAALQELLELVRKVCRPLWVLDDLESLQSYAGGALTDEHKIWLNWFQQQVIPYDTVLFISRYYIPELADIQLLELNEATPADMYAHLQQLEVGAKLQAQSDADLLQITEIIYNALGGHYKAWFFFDRLYDATLGKIINKILQAKEPSDTQPLYDKITAIVLKEMDKEGWSANFNQLRGVLEKEDWQALQLLTHFRRRISIQALEMQDEAIVWQPVLTKLHGLALLEKYLIVTDEGVETRYYITRLVKKWLQKQTGLKKVFSAKQAGDYYNSVGNKSDEENAFVEAFWHYLSAGCVEGVNETGQKVARSHYDAGMYEETLIYAFNTLEVCGDTTNPEILNLIGAVYKQMGAVEEALKFWTAFLKAARSFRNRAQEGLALNNLAAMLHELGDKKEALSTMEMALAIARETHDRGEVASRLNSLGKLVEDAHDHTRAIALYEESMQLRKEMDDKAGEASTLLNLADIYNHQGEVEKAQQTLRYCITIFNEEEDLDSEAMAYEKLGELYQNHGSHDLALDFLDKSLQIYHLMRNPGGQSRVLDLQGQLLTALGYYDDAHDHLTESLSIARRIQLKQDEAATLVHLGNLYLSKGEYDEGASCVNEAIAIFREQKDKKGEAESYFLLGCIYVDKGDMKMSNQYFKQSKKLHKALGAAAQQDIVDAIDYHLSHEDTDTQLSILQKQLADVRKKGNKLYQAEILYQMAEIALESENADDFFEWIDEAYDLYMELEHLPGIYRAGVTLGFVLYDSEDAEDRDEGLQLLQQCFQIGQKENYEDNHKIVEFIKGENR